MSWPPVCATPLTTNFPPPVPLYQTSCWTMLSPSGSLAINRLDAATAWPWFKVTFALGIETAGAASTAGRTEERREGEDHSVPWLARTHSVSVEGPAT